MNKSPQGTFVQDFVEFMGERQQRLIRPYWTPEYKSALELAAEKERAFKEQLPESLHGQLLELLDAYCDLQSTHVDMHYRLGLGDGIRFAEQVLHVGAQGGDAE